MKKIDNFNLEKISGGISKCLVTSILFGVFLVPVGIAYYTSKCYNTN